VAEVESKAMKQQAEAQKASVEAQLAPEVARAKVIASVSNNLDEDNEGKDFERRMKIAELMLKEKQIDQDMKVVNLQMQEKQNKVASSFVSKLAQEMNSDE
jgi:predicted RNA-binding protein